MKSRTNTVGFIIRGIVIPFFILVLGVALILIGYNNILEQTAQKRAYILLANSAREQSTLMEERVSSSFQQLEIISASLDSDGNGDIYSESDLPELMQKMKAQSQFDNIAISGSEGKLLYQNGSVADCSDREYFKKALEGEANIEYLPRGRMSGDMVFVFAAPVYRNLDTIGVIVATRNLSDISIALNARSEDYGQANFLCYGDGEVIAVPSQSHTSIKTGDNINDYFKNHISAEDIPANSVVVYTHDREKFYGVYTPSGLDNLYIFTVVSAKRASALAGLYSRWSILVLLLIFVVVLAVLVAIITQLKRRINTVTSFEAERRKRLEEYHKFQNRRSLDRENVLGSFYLNLTHNLCSKGEGQAIVIHTLAPDTTVDELCKMISDRIYPGDRRSFAQNMGRGALVHLFETGKSRTQEDFLLYTEENRYIWMRVIVDLVRNPMTEELEALLYAIDINDKKRLEQIGTKIIDESYDAMALIDVRSGCVFGIKLIGSNSIEPFVSHGHGINYDTEARRSLVELGTEDSEELAGRLCLDRVKAELDKKKTYSVTTHVAGVKDKYYRVEYSYVDSRRESIVVSCDEITDILASKRDIPTGLYNSTGFHERVERWRRENPGRKYRMHRYNLDGFSNINGTFGYEAGNKLLRDIGRYMRKNDTKDSFAGHLNSDHFVRFCSADSPTPEEYYDKFRRDFANYDLPYPISIHIGVYDLCEPECDSFTMSYKAHLALRSVKDDLMTHVAYYKNGLLQATREQQELLAEVEKAVSEHQFELWFQPQFSYPDRTIIGAEVLVRWRHPTKGMLQPAGFIPLMEKSKQVTRVDEYVWEEACRYIKQLDEKGIATAISVNVSRIDIRDGRAYNTLTSLVKRYDVDPARLRVEITESAYIRETENLISEVKRFRKAGFVVEMDDFGAGYSSLNMLNDLDINVLKLDRGLIAQLGKDEKGDSILRAVVQMAHSLGITTIAEGVETKQQADYLLSVGCNNMQGFYFSKPTTAQAFEKLISARSTDDIK